MKFGIVLCVAGASSLAWGTTSFDRYWVILDRKPFGEVQVPGNLDKKAKTPAAQSFVKHLRVCAVTYSEFGIRVGLVNIRTKPPTSWFLRIGESRDGIELVDADYETAGALLRKGTEELWIHMDATKGAAARAAAPPAAAKKTTASKAAAARKTYAERLRQRREAMRERALGTDKKPRLSGEELHEHLKEYQMKLIRAKGELGPPLPIPLTPEMDAKLVAEGVLPPLEEEVGTE